MREADTAVTLDSPRAKPAPHSRDWHPGTLPRPARVPQSQRRWDPRNWSIVFRADEDDNLILPGRVMVPDRLRRLSTHTHRKEMPSGSVRYLPCDAQNPDCPNRP